MFDVTIGSDDRAEIGDLVGFYLLNRLNTAIDKSGAGLYTEDWHCTKNEVLVTFADEILNGNRPKLDTIRKDIITFRSSHAQLF